MVDLVSGGAADGAPRRCERVEFARMRVVRTGAVPACVRRHGASSTDRKTGADNVTTPRCWLLISGHGGAATNAWPAPARSSMSGSSWHPHHLSPADD
jgi:hypothetical protein